jgi:subtilase family serine protease
VASMIRYRGKMAVLAAASLLATGAAMPVTRAVIGAVPLARLASSTPFAGPPTTAECKATGIACYSPAQYQAAYDVGPLYQQGFRGAGRTIIIADAFGSPTIQHDLQVFDKAFGLPDPALSILQPVGPVPPFDPNTDHMLNWAFETSLDVEYAHAMAPDAAIVLLETPADETEGVVGMPQLINAEKYAIDHNLGDVISQSFAATEQTFARPRDITALRYAYQDAAQHQVTVLGASGDWGATGLEADLTTTYPFRVTAWPATDPLVTAVGGTQLFLDAQGNRTRPDRVWNEGGSAGGGLSSVFGRPSYQDGVANRVGTHPGIPDISLSADPNGGAIVYLSFPGLPHGFYIVGGTSQATPMMAGLVALAAQIAGHPVGQINPTLYGLGAGGTGITDTVHGFNSFGGVAGFSAIPGYDLASGLGSPVAADLVPRLAAGQ